MFHKSLFLSVLLAVSPALAQSSGLFVAVRSNTVNEVFFEFTGSSSDQAVPPEYINEPASHFKLVNGKITKKSAAELEVAELPAKYRKTDAQGRWVAKTGQEKKAADDLGEVELQEKKPAKAKRLDNKIVKVLRDSGAMPADVKKAGPEVWEAYADYLESLNENQQDQQMRKLDKLVAPLEWLGYSRRDVYDHGTL